MRLSRRGRDREETIVAWATKPYAYVRITNKKGLAIHDVFGTRPQVPVDPVRTKHLPAPLGESPVYVVGSKGLKATIRPDPGLKQAVKSVARALPSRCD
jgi:hypothetical protein